MLIAGSPPATRSGWASSPPSSSPSRSRRRSSCRAPPRLPRQERPERVRHRLRLPLRRDDHRCRDLRQRERGEGSLGGRPKGSTVQVQEKEFEITLSTHTVPNGTVTFVVKNVGKIAHNLTIQGGKETPNIRRRHREAHRHAEEGRLHAVLQRARSPPARHGDQADGDLSVDPPRCRVRQRVGELSGSVSSGLRLASRCGARTTAARPRISRNPNTATSVIPSVAIVGRSAEEAPGSGALRDGEGGI